MSDQNQGRVRYIDGCITCGRNLKDDWNFCPSCNSPVHMLKCFICGASIRNSWKYCPFCKKEIQSDQLNKERVDQCNEWLRNILGN